MRTGASVNESYDAIDEQNVFLAAFDAANNRYYPSFYHRTAYNGFRAAGLPPLADLVTNATNSGAHRRRTRLGRRQRRRRTAG